MIREGKNLSEHLLGRSEFLASKSHFFRKKKSLPVIFFTKKSPSRLLDGAKKCLPLHFLVEKSHFWFILAKQFSAPSFFLTKSLRPTVVLSSTCSNKFFPDVRLRHIDFAETLQFIFECVRTIWGEFPLRPRTLSYAFGSPLLPSLRTYVSSKEMVLYRGFCQRREINNPPFKLIGNSKRYVLKTAYNISVG